MYNDYLVTSDMSHLIHTMQKIQIFLERAFQIEHNMARAVLYGFPSQKSTFHEPLCAERRSERVKSTL